jgi:hypothetical protein
LSRSGHPQCCPTEDLFVFVYVLIDDAIKAGAIAIPGSAWAGARMLG